MLSLNSFGEDGNELLDVPVDNREELFEHISLLQGMEKLSPEERFIIDSRYYKGKTQSETASALGVSQVQISRKEKDILRKLRIMLK